MGYFYLYISLQKLNLIPNTVLCFAATRDGVRASGMWATAAVKQQVID